jgi:hypothetical protein
LRLTGGIEERLVIAPWTVLSHPNVVPVGGVSADAVNDLEMVRRESTAIVAEI